MGTLQTRYPPQVDIGGLPHGHSVVALDESPLASDPTLLRFALAESSLDSIANGLLSRSVLCLPLDEPTLAAKHYVVLTAEQVRAAFQR